MKNRLYHLTYVGFWSMRLPALAVCLLFVASCDFLSDAPEAVHFSGETMGTVYNITIVDMPDGETAESVSQEVADVLGNVNGAMSNWDPESEISRFNAHASTDPVEISDEFGDVMEAANRVHVLSEARFDVTLAPLIELWGFGPRTPETPVPDDSAILAAMEHVGQLSLLELTDIPATLAKADPEVSVNLSAIAKGYGVDQVSEALESMGIGNYLVEIGGDLRTSGRNANDDPWSIGIERPEPGQQEIHAVVDVSDAGIATSGDYKNYVEIDGTRYSHIIDPTTGRPVTHETASVTVLADNAMMADALATAMLVLGEEDGLPVAESENLAVMFVSRSGDGFETTRSSSFETRISKD